MWPSLSIAASGVDQPSAPWLRNRVTEFPGRFSPKLHRRLRTPESALLGRAMRHTPRKFGNIRDKGIVLVAPVDDDFIFHFARLLFHCPEPISENRRAHLAHLIRLRVTAIALEIDHFLNTRFAKHMVAALHPLFKPEALQQGAKLVKTKVASDVPLRRRLSVLSAPTPVF